MELHAVRCFTCTVIACVEPAGQSTRTSETGTKSMCFSVESTCERSRSQTPPHASIRGHELLTLCPHQHLVHQQGASHDDIGAIGREPSDRFAGFGGLAR